MLSSLSLLTSATCGRHSIVKIHSQTPSRCVVYALALTYILESFRNPCWHQIYVMMMQSTCYNDTAWSRRRRRISRVSIDYSRARVLCASAPLISFAFTTSRHIPKTSLVSLGSITPSSRKCELDL
jgi:hypothetical protein